jgi:hypothetical protein
MTSVFQPRRSLFLLPPRVLFLGKSVRREDKRDVQIRFLIATEEGGKEEETIDTER